MILGPTANLSNSLAAAQQVTHQLKTNLFFRGAADLIPRATRLQTDPMRLVGLSGRRTGDSSHGTPTLKHG